MNFYIRNYKSDDWQAICRVHDRPARPDELRGSFDARAFVPLAIDPEGEYINVCEMFVSQHGDDVVGFAGVDDPYFAWLYVDPAYYGRGIGRALLRHCLDRLSEDAWTLACGNNDRAINLYLSEASQSRAGTSETTRDTRDPRPDWRSIRSEEAGRGRRRARCQVDKRLTNTPLLPTASCPHSSRRRMRGRITAGSVA